MLSLELMKVAKENGYELKKVLKNNNPNLLTGLPNVIDLENINKYVLKSRMHWTKFLVTRFQDFKKYINYKSVYVDTQISRCYIDYKEKKSMPKKDMLI